MKSFNDLKKNFNDLKKDMSLPDVVRYYKRIKTVRGIDYKPLSSFGKDLKYVCMTVNYNHGVKEYTYIVE